MRVLIPMAGRGDRFVNEGYENPKPLIEVFENSIKSPILTLLLFKLT